MLTRSCHPGWLARLFVLSGSLCACADTSFGAQPNAVSAPCDQVFSDRAQRSGEAGLANLFYACEGDACRGNEGFVSQVPHTISVAVQAAPEAQVVLQSSDKAVFTLSDQITTLDPCSGQITALATLHAVAPGSASLLVRDAAGDLDRVPIWVGVEASIHLRVSGREAFAFESPREAVQAAPGQAFLLLPELYDAQGRLLVGRVPLTWSVSDPAVAAIFDQLEAPDEPLAALADLAGLVRLDVAAAGSAEVHVRSDNGATAALPLESLAAPASGDKSLISAQEQ